MSFIPYSCQSIDDDDIAAVSGVLRSAFLTQGPQIGEFEREFGKRHHVGHCVSVANATAGLHIGCLALGLGPGDIAWTVPNSFVASANCALYCGASVDFVDIDPATRIMSMDALEEKLRLAERNGQLPKVVIPVHFAGYPADMSKIRVLADKYGFSVLEDASHAVGASLLGKPIGSAWSDIAVFSFHAVKIVTTGEGGMCVTQRPDLAATMRRLASHGIVRDADMFVGQGRGPWVYEQSELGYNYRLTDFQAALGRSQLGRLDKMHMQRERLADRYDAKLAGLPVKTLARARDHVSSHHLYVIEIDKTGTRTSRLDAFVALRDAGIGVNVHYIPIHLQPYYARFGFSRGDFPMAETYYDQAITLPLHPGLTADQQDFVISELARTLT